MDIKILTPADGTDVTKRYLSQSGTEFLMKVARRDTVDVAVAAFDGDDLVGWLGLVDAPAVKGVPQMFWDGGVWVSSARRRQGVAKALWERALLEYPAARFDVTVISEEGLMFMRSLKEPRILVTGWV